MMTDLYTRNILKLTLALKVNKTFKDIYFSLIYDCFQLRQKDKINNLYLIVSLDY